MGIVWKWPRSLFHVNRARDVDPAMADEHANPRLFIRHIMLSRIGLFVMRVLRACDSSSMDMEAAALAWVTVFGYILGFLEAPATKTPGRDVSSGGKPARFYRSRTR